MSKKFTTFQALLPNNGLRTMADGGIRLTLDTNEIPAELFSEIASYKGSFVNVGLAAEETTISKEELDVPDILIEEGEKSPSVRLRAVLYRVWEQGEAQKPNPMNWEVYYRMKMDELITFFKNKLD